MAHTPPTGTLWALLAAPEETDGQLPAVEEKQPSPPPPPPPRALSMAVKEKAPNSPMKARVEKNTATSKTLELSSFERKALKELILLVQEALDNGKFSALSQKAESDNLGSIQKLKAERSPQKVSIWGVPLLKDDRTDAILLKFLKAQNFNVEESFTMLKNTIQWRREFDVDGLVDQLDVGDDLMKMVYVHGQDKEGHPVRYNTYGELQDKELYMNTLENEDKRMNFVRRMIQILERNIRKLDFSPEGVCTFVNVVDLKDCL
ncbi:hypothetical protein CDL12_15985 [Handroanthus impetiginosus]|uniref:CRAL/TRIO N-terminal domain-containing protein n=1 Tax=Handroanthus impetiginosus TaxID=429701 RepID=A0A2G9H1N7_9LAMI|nr:hypothetical protein CDL12_15985 [Handroanthus impetiginosus]